MTWREKLNTCYSCEYSRLIVGVLQCTKCKCICSLKARVGKCPLGRWL